MDVTCTDSLLLTDNRALATVKVQSRLWLCEAAQRARPTQRLTTRVEREGRRYLTAFSRSFLLLVTPLLPSHAQAYFRLHHCTGITRDNQIATWSPTANGNAGVRTAPVVLMLCEGKKDSRLACNLQTELMIFTGRREPRAERSLTLQVRTLLY